MGKVGFNQGSTKDSLHIRSNGNRSDMDGHNAFQFLYSIGGYIVGGSTIVGGILLFLRGIAGSTDWSFKFLGVNTELSEAAPGVILFIVGLLIIYVTKYRANPRNETIQPSSDASSSRGPGWEA